VKVSRSILGGLGLAAALAGPAAAQETSDVMPAPPRGGSLFYPGMPVPQPEGPAPAGDKGKGEPKGRYLMDDVEAGFGEGTVSGVDVPVPEIYVVRKGDTLWSISATYLRSPWRWPKLWALNPAITNPHWIYPGDQIRLLPEQPQVVEGPETPPKVDPVVPIRPQPRGVFLRQFGFLEEGELEAAGTVMGSKEEKALLSTLDEAYVRVPKGVRLVVGQRYSVYKPERTVKHPITKKKLGKVVRIYGEVQVRSLHDNDLAKVTIVDSIDPIERGFLVGPLRRQFKVVQPRPDARDLEGYIVASLPKRDLIGQQQLVFIDRGKADGIEVGNRFLVVRRGDGYAPRFNYVHKDDKRFPPETVGELIVVEVRDKTSAALVTESLVEAHEGDRLEARRGL
jgi:hypothetical protein